MTKKHNIKLGQKAEKIAVSFLKKKNFKILHQNYKTPVGEIDVIAKERDTIIFVEVKARTNINYGLPKEAVTYKKQKQIIRTAMWYLNEKEFFNCPKTRFDVISILFNNNQIDIEHIRAAFQVENQ